MRFQPPSFIAFTGVDRAALRPGLAELAARYPIEWGILIDDQRPPDPVKRQPVHGKTLSGADKATMRRKGWPRIDLTLTCRRYLAAFAGLFPLLHVLSAQIELNH